VTKCFRNPAATSLPRHGITAWLLDKFEPEFDQWIARNRNARDVIFVPIATRRMESYKWNTNGFATVEHAWRTTLRRSLRSRRLAAQGAERQRALLAFDETLARDFAKRIPYLADHLVVSQNLLPHLWRNGDFGGRTFDVLMTRLPIVDLERMLDAAAIKHPQSRTLSDFRAPAEIRDAETQALAAARFWITPHSYIAKLAGERAIKLAWQMRKPLTRFRRGEKIVFPASTLARKGCYELREVVQRLELNLQIGGPIIESPDFWSQLEIESAPKDWIGNARVVVLPAWVEHWPRVLLQAASLGVPVVASEMCGLRGVPNIIEIPIGDTEALAARLAMMFDDPDAIDSSAGTNRCFHTASAPPSSPSPSEFERVRSGDRKK
jgi:hypothetical protein